MVKKDYGKTTYSGINIPHNALSRTQKFTSLASSGALHQHRLKVHSVLGDVIRPHRDPLTPMATPFRGGNPAKPPKAGRRALEPHSEVLDGPDSGGLVETPSSARSRYLQEVPMEAITNPNI